MYIQPIETRAGRARGGHEESAHFVCASLAVGVDVDVFERRHQAPRRAGVGRCGAGRRVTWRAVCAGERGQGDRDPKPPVSSSLNPKIPKPV